MSLDSTFSRDKSIQRAHDANGVQTPVAECLNLEMFHLLVTQQHLERQEYQTGEATVEHGPVELVVGNSRLLEA